MPLVAPRRAGDPLGQYAEQGAEGVGLLRTEFLFLDRLQAPDDEEEHVLAANAANFEWAPAFRLLEVVDAGRLTATTDTVAAVRESDAVVVVVPLFVDDDAQPDFRALAAATAAMGVGAAAEAGIGAAIALPLLAHEDVVGLLCLFPRADRVLTEDESARSS